MKKSIRVFAREVHTKDNKKSFLSYSYTKDGETYYKVKFTRDCQGLPKEQGYYLMEIDTNKTSLEKVNELYNDKKLNDIIWIRELYSCKRDTEYEKDLLEKQKEFLEELL